MFDYRSNPFFLLILLFFFISSTFFSVSYGASHLHHLPHTQIPEFVDEREFNGVVEWNTRRFVAETSNNSTTLILAANRTHRRDPCNGFKYYTGGWNITNQHYFSSVAFSAAPPFIIAVIWCIVVGLCLCCICLRYCCCCCCRGRQKPFGYSRTACALSLTFLILFTIAAIAGSVFLYTGQEKFNSSIVNILSYVLRQADTVVSNLTNLFNYLLSAKSAVPTELRGDIDHIHTQINLVSSNIHNVTGKSSKDIGHFLYPVRISLIYVAAALLVLAFLGFLFSILGIQCLVNLLVIIGWILITLTFILSGISLLIHNVVADTCIAMDEWLQNPTADSALEHIIPKVDNEMAQQIFNVTKGVTFGVVSGVNGGIMNVSNVNIPPDLGPPLYFNQSGPLMPVLCNPYNADLTDRQCAAGEVDFKNATEVWRNYICQVSAAGICTTPGRVTPDGYKLMVSSANVSYHLYFYSPFLINLVDSTFLKETFAAISKDHCPGLRRYSYRTFVGFTTASAAVMLSLILWIIYAREQRHRAYTKKLMTRPPVGHFEKVS
uniref:Uncharacterized protein n=1 Tax=Davidia involucrata TaxID=16924 RepID=A0A5B7BHK8_DAVIN